MEGGVAYVADSDKIEELRDFLCRLMILCRLMRLNRSGYYKWRERRGKKNLREKRREEITGKLKQAHKKYPSHGYILRTN